MWLKKQKQASVGKEAAQGSRILLTLQRVQGMQFGILWKSSYKSMGVFRIATINLTEFCTSMRSTISDGECT